MDKMDIHELVDRYIELTHEVWKRGEALTKEEIGEEVTNDQHYLLRYIYSRQRCTTTELAEAFSVQKSAITAIMNRLVEKNMIERVQDKNDRRVLYLTLTKEGRTLFEKTEARVFNLVESIIQQFGQEEIETFIRTYEKLANVLREMQ
ncbi:MarR family winged helix-turn-helix transcriptional regulator [Bacillus andreraoultii]|uniref:MarR family winged helix-turn-helix transcriptional regulator n=1 Tax=Bacillus andreraoultii TaxID=1499685 RepID=UPI00053B563C|nr:MarR family transcriptional regulator [Bacillus andreraoultii]